MPHEGVTADLEEQPAGAGEAHAQAARERATPSGGEGGHPAGVASIEPAAGETGR